MNSFNEFAEQNSLLEIADGETRYKAYRTKKDVPSFLYLSSWTGIEIRRSRTEKQDIKLTGRKRMFLLSCI